jgi:hypothetical protein
VTFSTTCIEKASIFTMFSPHTFQDSSIKNCSDTNYGTIDCLDESWIGGVA